MAKKFNYIPWLIGGAAFWFLLRKPKTVGGIGELNPYNIGKFYQLIDKYSENNSEYAYRILNRIFKRRFDTWLTKKVKDKRYWNNKFITNMNDYQYSEALRIMQEYFE